MSRRSLILVGLAIVLGGVVAMIAQKEWLLRGGGTRIYLSLEPKDPESLIEGDYMRIWYRVSNELYARSHDGLPVDGFLVLGVDDAGRADLVRVDDGTALQPGELKLRYRNRGGFVRIASEAYYFEQGQGDRFARAKWGELHVTGSGEALLVALCDESLARIEK